MLFRSRKNRNAPATTDTAVAEPLPQVLEARDLEADGKLYEALELLNEANRAERDLQLEREIRRVRHLAGIELINGAPSKPSHPEPAAEVPPRGEQSGCPEITPEELTPEVLRASILDAGCLLVRNLVDEESALRMAADIDRSFELRDELAEGESDGDGFYDEMDPESPFRIPEREWVEEGGGVLAADSPRLLFEMLDGFEKAGLRGVIEGYLGEPPAISAQKCTLRKALPEIAGGWHQDGRFMGEIRALNVWLSLSRCGDVAPSMDVVPTRLNELVATGGEGAYLDFMNSQENVERAAGERGITRPIFNPGDALLFDDLFMHQTGSDPSMPNPRYAIESWFFGPSAYPENYVPLAF
ncbi:MAG: hypothetical protein J0H98_01360 [Solirubrobacterales bacterium]|nr:hypothetical protein [Solirubrobacterales bacterium]